MRALLLTVGSQGDVQPFVALASRLRDAGHDVVLAAPAIYQAVYQDTYQAVRQDTYQAVRQNARQGGYQDPAVPFVPLDLDMTAVGQAVHGKHGLRHVLAFTKAMGQRAGAILPQLTELAREGADVVVHHPVLPLGQHLAEKLGVPAVVAPPLPALVPTREFLSPAWPAGHTWPSNRTLLNRTLLYRTVLNRPSYRAARYLTGAWCRADIDRWRTEGLALPAPKRRGRHDPLGADNVTILHSFSAHVVPRPSDWPGNAHVTGYWCQASSQEWTPPRRLAEFLADGEPPVYIGFGSMPVADPAGLADAIVTATQLTRTRVVLFSLDPRIRRHLSTHKNIMVIRQVPHDWLFPRMAAIVHHGGAGTTAAAIQAGKPQIIWPFGIDQHFWAGRMASLGVAVPAGPVRTLTGVTLARAIDRATNDQLISDLAIELAHRVQAEDGTGKAVAHLESLTNGSLTSGSLTSGSLTSGSLASGGRTAVPA
jgi:sterol 3beta-glucosyltransferase